MNEPGSKVNVVGTSALAASRKKILLVVMVELSIISLKVTTIFVSKATLVAFATGATVAVGAIKSVR